MKKNNTIFTVIIILIIVILLLIKLLPNILNKTNYDDLEVYKNNMVINIADSDKKQIVSYLKKERFEKSNSLNEVNGTYMIKYGDIELTFNSLLLVTLVVTAHATIKIIIQWKIIIQRYLMN